MATQPIPAVYRATPADPWLEAELIARHPDGLVLREVGKQWPGVWLASLDQVRVPVGEIEAPSIERRNYLPAGVNRFGMYRKIREVCGRDEALRQGLEP